MYHPDELDEGYDEGAKGNGAQVVTAEVLETDEDGKAEGSFIHEVLKMSGFGLLSPNTTYQHSVCFWCKLRTSGVNGP